ncbi:hypothetical protein OROHE_023034 [Orobanche hederae]
MDSAGKISRKRKEKKQTIEMGEVPIFALRSSNKLSRLAPDSNSSMRCKRARPTDIQSLPDELLSNILTRLPADYIHDVARLVRLRWYHIFSCRMRLYASMEYKVVVPLKNRGKSGDWFLAILTVGVDESWRDVPVKHLSSSMSLLCKSGVINEGYIHWIRPEFWWVLTLDVETEIFTTSIAPLPRSYSPGSCYLSTGRFLSLLVPRGDLSWEVWVMGSRDGEWSKVLPDIDLGTHKSRLHERFGIGEDKALRPVGWVKYPEVLALCFRGKYPSRTCFFFNLKTNEINWTELPESFSYFMCA